MTTYSSQTVAEVLRDGSPVLHASQTVMEVLYPSSAVASTAKGMATQGDLMAVAAAPTAPIKATQGAFLAPLDKHPNLVATQTFFLVLTRPGVKVNFSVFREPTFHDWVLHGDNLNYTSYLDSFYTMPESDYMDWSQTPYSYFFLKNSQVGSDSLKIQYHWDFPRKK